jgi:hypothetical protein
MKKFILMLITSVIFASCSLSATEVKVISSNGIESAASLEDFFDFETIVISTNGYLQIIMDKNTEVLYIMSYHYGISPIYDSDGTIMTKEKWLAKRAKKED